MPLERVSILGMGAWGSALAEAAARAGRAVTLLGRDRDIIDRFNRERTHPALGALQLSPSISARHVSGDLPVTDVLLLAVPAQSSRAALSALGPRALRGVPVVLTAKGLEYGTQLRQSQVLLELTPEAIPLVLSGPSFAEDVAAGHPTAVTLAGDDRVATDALVAALAGPTFRLYASDDRIGVELAGALKNVYALACGAVEGAGLGASARSALLARAFSEMARLVAALGGSATTLTGLAGLGDLTLSCTSRQSRNYRCGMALGAGRPAPAGELAEGVATAPVAAALARRLCIEAPLIEAVEQLVAGTADIGTIVTGLMSRPLKRED